jgi:hypothetical protein
VIGGVGGAFDDGVGDALPLRVGAATIGAERLACVVAFCEASTPCRATCGGWATGATAIEVPVAPAGGLWSRSAVLVGAAAVVGAGLLARVAEAALPLPSVNAVGAAAPWGAARVTCGGAEQVGGSLMDEVVGVGAARAVVAEQVGGLVGE